MKVRRSLPTNLLSILKERLRLKNFSLSFYRIALGGSGKVLDYGLNVIRKVNKNKSFNLEKCAGAMNYISETKSFFRYGSALIFCPPFPGGTCELCVGKDHSAKVTNGPHGYGAIKKRLLRSSYIPSLKIIARHDSFLF